MDRNEAHDQDLLPQEFFLKPGYILAHTEPMLIRCVLGSCVAVAMYDRRNRFGGINHFLWPEVEDRGRPTVTHGDVAIPALHRILRDFGAGDADLEAQILGGGRPPERVERSPRDLGEDNVATARRILKRLGIPVVSEDVGGCKGRKVVYNTHTNEIAVIKVDRLRASDWLDYGQDVDWDRV